MNSDELAQYIFEWLTSRNGSALADALDSMTLADRRLAIEELTLILDSKGKPPNWA